MPVHKSEVLGSSEGGVILPATVIPFEVFLRSPQGAHFRITLEDTGKVGFLYDNNLWEEVSERCKRNGHG